MAHIYIIKCIGNGKSYVGSAISANKRKKHHYHWLEHGKHGNPILQRSWNKYGQESFIFEIVEECSADDRWERENHWMSDLDTLAPNGFNMQDAFNAQITPEKLENMRRIARTPENRQRKSAAHLKVWSSPDFKEKMRACMKEKWSDPEYRSMMINACSGSFTQERIESMRSEMYERWKSEEYKEKMALTWDEDRRILTSEKLKELWKDEEYREKQKESRKRKKIARESLPLTFEEEEAQKEKKRIKSEKLKAAWARNSERREKQSAVMKQGQAKKASEASQKNRRKKK